jgi:hypothetical protein
MQGLNAFLRGASLVSFLFLAAGCASRITNLTPTIAPREASGLYPFEAEWTSNQRSRELREEDIKGYVVVDEQFHPMERVPGMKDRWETRVPIPAGRESVHYYYKWDYHTARIGYNAANSIRSQPYRMEIVRDLE